MRFQPALYINPEFVSGQGSATAGISQSGASSSLAGQTGQSFSDKQQENSATQFIDRTPDVVVVRDRASTIDSTRNTIESLDRPVEQVDIAVVVYEFNSGSKAASAIGAVLKLAKSKFIGQFGATEAIGSFLKLDTSALQLLFSAIDEDNRFSLISNPRVRSKSGTKSRVTVGADVPTLSSTTNTNGAVTQNVAYQKTGVIFDVSPTVLLDSIDLTIRQAILEAALTTTGVNASPTLTNRELVTQVSMVSGDSIVLGGLQSVKNVATRSGFNFLPRFTDSNSKENIFTEVIVFLSVNRVVR